MENKNINEKVAQLANNKEFMEKVQKTASVEEYQKLLGEYGVETTVEELKAGFEQMAALFGENGELTADALDMVAGGWGVNGLTYVSYGGQVACTLILMAGASNPIGWFAGACGCGFVALASMF